MRMETKKIHMGLKKKFLSIFVAFNLSFDGFINNIYSFRDMLHVHLLYISFLN